MHTIIRTGWTAKMAALASLMTILCAPTVTYGFQIRVTEMNFYPPGSIAPAHTNTTVEGSIDITAGTGSFNSGSTPFFAFPWSATVVQAWSTPGTYTFSGTVPAGNTSPPGGTSYSYTFTLGPNQYAAGVMFQWASNTNIPVLAAFDCSGNGGTTCSPLNTDGDAAPGTAMQTAPFPGQTAAFSGFIPVNANNVSGVNTVPTSSVSWTPSVTVHTSITSYSCSIAAQPAGGQGTATVASNCNSGTYDPQGYTGSTTFTYRITSGSFSDTATVSATSSLTPPPTANNDSASTGVGTAVVIDVTANDTDQDGTVDPTTVAIVAAPTNGNASIDAGTGAITYTPNLGFCGSDTITYTVDDDTTQTSNVATVDITVLSTQLCSSDSVTLTGGDIDSNGDGMITLSQLLSAGIPSDPNAVNQCIGGCFDFVISGVVGSATVYLPLSAPIPPAARYRIWNGTAWVDFDTTEAGNEISSAVRAGASCSTSDSFSSGLTMGGNCVKLTIVDNGPNDLDPRVGIVADPSGVVENNIPTASTSLGGGGCTINTRSTAGTAGEWMLIGGLLAAFGLYRRKCAF